MTRSRKTLISLAATQFYHYTSRCVRHSFLCGLDKVSGVCFEHRRQWIEDRLLALAQWFAMDIAANTIMSNHYHVVLQVNREKALSWSDAEVVERLREIFPRKVKSKESTTESSAKELENPVLPKVIACWRERLMDISWFMRCLNEPVARQANQEDKVTGRFWEGRFKSQALLDESALLACMAYVDLNPVRAKIAATPEAAAHTSTQRRQGGCPNSNVPTQTRWMSRFKVDGPTQKTQSALNQWVAGRQMVIPVQARLPMYQPGLPSSDFHCVNGTATRGE